MDHPTGQHTQRTDRPQLRRQLLEPLRRSRTRARALLPSRMILAIWVIVKVALMVPGPCVRRPDAAKIVNNRITGRSRRGVRYNHL
jgi:hypothetical protein